MNDKKELSNWTLDEKHFLSKTSISSFFSCKLRNKEKKVTLQCIAMIKERFGV